MESGRSLEQLLAGLRASADTVVATDIAELGAYCRSAMDVLQLAGGIGHYTRGQLMLASKYFASLEQKTTDKEARSELSKLRLILDNLGERLDGLERKANQEFKRMRGKQINADDRDDSRIIVFNFVALVERLVTIARQQFEQAHVLFRAPDEPLYLRAESLQSELIIDELLANSYRQTRDQADAEIALEISASASKILCLVQDNGPGIPPEIREQIFESSFFFGANGRSGHGLAMIRRAMETMGATIDVEDRADGRDGACFRLEFPRFTISETTSSLDDIHQPGNHGTIIDFHTGEEYLCYRQMRIGSSNGFRAIDRDHKHQLWLKTGCSEAEAALLEKEAQLLQHGRRHQIAALIDLQAISIGIHEKSRCTYLRLSPIQGMALDQILNSETWLHAADVLTILGQAVSLLADLHTAEILCRALPPAAFYYDIENQSTPLTLVDLSQAIFLQSHYRHRNVDRPDWDLRRAHTPVADMRYVAPEHFIGFALDVRSDIYAFGLFMYELISSEPLFGDSTDVTNLAPQRAALTEVSERLARYVHSLELPEALISVACRCLASRPEERFQSARDLRNALLQIAPE